MRGFIRRWAQYLARTFPSLLRFRIAKNQRSGISIRGRGKFIEIAKADKLIRIARANVAYASEIAEEFDFYFSSARSCRDGQTLILDMTEEKDHWIAGFDSFAVRCPSIIEPWATVQNYLELAQVRPGENVIDLGAYAGLSSIAFSAAVGKSGKVIALEPDPTNFRVASTNFARYREHGPSGDNVTLINAAASRQPGTLALTCEGTMGSALTSVIGAARGSVHQVTAMTLEQIAGKLAHVDFIKMDIEGAELEVIEGALEFLADQRPRLLIEPHMINGVMNTELVCSALQSIGYQCSLVAQPGARQPLIFASTGQRQSDRGASERVRSSAVN